MSNLLLGYDENKSSNKIVIFIGSTLMGILGMVGAYINMHHPINLKFILKHIIDIPFYFHSLLDTWHYMMHVKFKDDFPFSFIWWWFVYTAVLNFFFLLIYLSILKPISKNWMQALHPIDSIIIAIKAAVYFIVLAVIIYLASIGIASLLYHNNTKKIPFLRFAFLSYPVIWGIVTSSAVLDSEESAYTNSLLYKIYPQLKDMIFINTMEDVPKGYDYDYVGHVEASSVNNRKLADAYLYLQAYRAGANGILKYQVNYTTSTHGTISTDYNHKVSGNISTNHHYYITGTAVKIYPKEESND